MCEEDEFYSGMQWGRWVVRSGRGFVVQILRQKAVQGGVWRRGSPPGEARPSCLPRLLGLPWAWAEDAMARIGSAGTVTGREVVVSQPMPV
jgi:hypothetical protein